MPLLVYLDETGDHSLEIVDKEFPIFALVMLVCDQTVYAEKIIPTVYRFKMDYFGHEGVILHSRDIRKAVNDFSFLLNPQKRPTFYHRINEIMAMDGYTLIASVIRKQMHKDRYGLLANNPYDLALTFAMERLLPLLEDRGEREVKILAEARGKREDDQLHLSFLRILTEGTSYVPADRFRNIKFQLLFKPKIMNIVGIQMADLAAYPIARFVLDPKKPNPAYGIIEKKFYRGKGLIRGLKVFP